MAGITDQGFVRKTLPEILDTFESKFKTRISPNWDSRSNNVINILSTIFADEISDAWSGLQGAYDANYPKSATGVSLDGLGDLVGVTRIGQNKSNGNVEFSGAFGTVIPSDTVISVSETNERFLTTQSLTLDGTTFSEILLEVSSVVSGTDYSVTIDGISFVINSGVSPTASSILSALESKINSTSANCSATKPTTTSLLVDVIEVDSVLPIIVGARLSITSISNVVGVEAVRFGAIKSLAGTLTTLPVPISGVISVTNKKDIEVGRSRESDSEFRVRRYESVSIVGASTFSALTSRVRNIDGVTAAFIIENDTSSVDAEGRPSKSFEVVVDGGDLDTIARIIQTYKPVGIETFGNISRTVEDEDGFPRTVNFSRPVDVFIHIIVQYTRYTEEAFSPSAVQGIKDAIVSYGNTLNIGTDIIPKRFYGSIYNAVTGVDDINVRVAKSYDGITPVTAYTTSSLSVDRRESPIFLIDLISVSEV